MKKQSIKLLVSVLIFFFIYSTPAFSFIKVTFRAGYCGDPWYEMCFGPGKCCEWVIGFGKIVDPSGGTVDPELTPVLGSFTATVTVLNKTLMNETFVMPSRSFSPEMTGLFYWINIEAQDAPAGPCENEFVMNITFSETPEFRVPDTSLRGTE